MRLDRITRFLCVVGKYGLAALFLCATAVALTGCDDADRPPDERCSAGTENCACSTDGRECEGELFCADGRCRRPRCTVGDAECACYANLTCNSIEDARLVCDEGLCREPSCVQGTPGCGCLPGGACESGSVCADETGTLRCVPLECEAETAGCVCGANGACSGETEEGQSLVCDGGLCVPASCSAGENACGCKRDGTCDSGLRCGDGGVCVPEDCAAGELACPCRSDGRCNRATLVCSADDFCVNASSCEEGEEGCGCAPDATCSGSGSGGGELECDDGICVDPTCPLGERDCPCQPDRSCNDEGLRCSADGTCVDPDCPEGGEGCACLPDRSCDEDETGTPLSCVAGTCRNCRLSDCGTPGLSVPVAAACYTPCRSGFTDQNAVYHACGADGLMRHESDQACLDGKTCRFGSCLSADEDVPACAGDVDCPDFQNCVEGHCYSVCDSDSDCPSDLACHRHACRAPCSSGDQSCPEHTACTMTDPEGGYCMPVGTPPDGPLEGPVLGTFEISDDNVAFDSANTAASITIENHGPVAATFSVTKLEHTGTGLERPVTRNPMPWLRIGEPGGEQLANVVELLIDPGEAGTLSFTNAGTQALNRWRGVVEVRSENTRLGARRVNLSYVGSVDGRWVGTLSTFANFGTKNLTAWSLDRTNVAKLNVVGNALVARWGVFRRGNISRGNFDAALQSAADESWNWPTMRDACPRGAACYPYVDPENPEGSGIERFTSDATGTPVPTGMSELPVAFDLRSNPDDLLELEGRIVTSEALQYPGDPAISLLLQTDPTAQDCPLNNAGECIVLVDALDAEIHVGGRFGIPQFGNDTACPAGFSPANTPWLVPGFLASTTTNPEGMLYRSECRDQLQPGLAEIALNTALAAANPVPDGKTRRRKLELVDGAMIDQETLYLLVREHFESFLGGGDSAEFAAYGVMRLSRTPAELDPDSYLGNVPPAPQAPPSEASAPIGCDAEILASLGAPEGISPDNVEAVAQALLDGRAIDRALPSPLADWQVHYLCHDTGRIDGGDTVATGGASHACPAGSGVTYFYFTSLDGLTPLELGAQIAGLPCQDNGTCRSTLDAWRATRKWGIAKRAPVFRCDGFEVDPERVFCDADRSDLRADKAFYPTDEASAAVAFAPLRTAINEAFRYKTQFRTRENRTVGFAPAACVPNSDAVPYCYDAPLIEQARARVDCALHLYHTYPELRTEPAFTALGEFLRVDFAFEQEINPPAYSYDGFETMYAELLVMLGDDAYTSAFASRFDLAGSTRLSFQGTLFEPGGIDLSGVAGFELYRLYQASQYYSLVLDRFYRLAPALALPNGVYEGFITKDTFGSYFPKLLRASVQRTRVASEIAKRYQAFNRPEVARGVVQRAYTAGYLESVVIGSLVTRYVDQSGTEKAYVEKVRRDAALTYKAALHDMRDAYQRITDDVRYFGFSPEFVPFPALDPGDVNSFTKLLALARQRSGIAAQNEQLALSSNRSYEVDLASFQAELVKLRINYDNQLADVCGTLRDDAGAVYPAIPRYAYLNDDAAAFGDPCGLMRTGRLYEAMVALEVHQLDLEEIDRQYAVLFSEIEIERDRVERQCKLGANLAQATYQTTLGTTSIQAAMDAAQNQRTRISWLAQLLDREGAALNCVVGLANSCATSLLGARLYAVGAAVLRAADLDLQERIQDRQRDITEIQASNVLWRELQGCNVAKIDSEALIKQKLLALKTLDLNALKADYQLRLAASKIRELRDQAQRIAAEAEELEQQTINIEAARNDPNVRIYKNDSVINAERTFDAAMSAAYQATKVYEYFTSQSYERLEQLFLIRMVSHGDYNLDNYLMQLEDSYLAFQQSYGNPDDRVDILSLRDDIFAVPRLDASGAPVPQSERIREFRDRLGDVALLDERGYLTVPFATSIARVSPLTRNHKLKRVEVEMIGSDVGDAVGRVYLRQAGTGVVRALNDDDLNYRLPERTAVVDTFFNGVRVFGPEIYQSDRLRDRPVVNSRWDLVLNQVDEQANLDIDISSLTDVRLYLYYTDFTGF